MLDWNDLQYLLAVGRHGSTGAAARALGVNQSTVQRRIVELERQMGHALVVRQPSGYALTPLGLELLPLAEQVAQAIESLERKARATLPDGREIVRLTCPEPVVGRLRPLVEEFQSLHPRWKVEFVTSDRYLDLLQGEADVALRSGDTDDALVGTKVADSVWGVYASRAYVDEHGQPATVADIRKHPVVALDEKMSGHRLMTWLKDVAPDAQIVSRSQSILGLVQATKAGLGVAALPMAIAEDAGLSRLLGPVPELVRSWKLLTHPSLRNTPKVAALFDFLASRRDEVGRILG